MISFSGRSPAVFQQKKPRPDDDESEDLTKDMEDPPAEPNIQEVKPSSSSISGPATPTTKRDPDLQPLKVILKVFLFQNGVF